ncbi:TPA: TaqI-like C-terminal specificity domain-containing protein [Streptococcus agalactiae]
MSTFDSVTGRTNHLEAYEGLNLSEKFAILSHFDKLRNELQTPSIQLGEFDREMEAFSITLGNELLGYLEANGSPYELKRELNQAEMMAVLELSRQLVAKFSTKLEELGIDLGSFQPDQVNILLDAVGRFRLKNADIALLGGYPKASVSQLALATELLQMGLSHDKVEFFLTSQLQLEDMRQVAFAFLHESLTREEAEQFETDRFRHTSLNFREWRELLEKQEPEMVEMSDVSPLVREVLHHYPLGSRVTYKGQEFEILSIEAADMDNLIRIELQNDFSYLIEQNPVLYFQNLAEIRQVLHLSRSEIVEREEQPEEEWTLFSFMDEGTEDNEKEPEIVFESTDKVVTLDSQPAQVSETISESVPETKEVIEAEQAIAVDFSFPEDLTNFYPKTARDKVVANLVAIRLVKELESANQSATPNEQEILAKYVGWGGLANEFFDEYNPKFSKEREELKTLVSDKEYSDMKQSSLTAYYTDPLLIRQMWSKLEQDGFSGGKILDPSMGSGHFLVSILNEIIALKSDLNILFDADGNYIGNLIQCYVINDELVIQDMSGNNFLYQTGNQQSEQIQKAIFNQKRHILENSLFAVDINPSSVNICRLRLWIELLKSSYYYQDTDTNQPVLTTLPNIDINIKVGDSLLHKFEFDYEFDMRKTDFKDYLSLVKDYKETNNKRVKAEIWEKIERLKHSFDDTASSPELKKLSRLISERNKAGAISLFEDENKNSKEVAELNKQLAKAEKELEYRLKNPLFAKGMEWRMEFPEILGEAGEFIGFDLVIGNPPYIFARNQSFTDEMKSYYSRTYQVSEYQANTYTIFMELAYQLLRKGGTFSYIIPNNFLTIQTNSRVRQFITEQTSDVVLINSLDKIFADASVDNCIIFFKKNAPNWIEVAELYHGEFNTVGRVAPDFFGEIPTFSISMVKYRQAIDIFWKVNHFPILGRPEISTVKSGIKAYETGKGNPKMTAQDKNNRIYHARERSDDSYRPYLDGENVSRYKLTWNGEYVKYGENLAAPRDKEIFEKPRILVRQIPSKSTYAVEAVYTDSDVINDLNSMVITDIQVNPFYLLGILNSRLISLWFFMKFDKFQRRLFPQFKVNELGDFPIPDATDSQQEDIAQVVEQLMEEMKKDSPDTEKVNQLNLEIDELVMDLFDLAEEEKQTVRDFEV